MIENSTILIEESGYIFKSCGANKNDPKEEIVFSYINLQIDREELFGRIDQVIHY